MLIIPYNTDAPLYHLPWATGGLILVNIVVFVLQCLIPDLTDLLMVANGRFNPVSWLTAGYAHADIVHLLGNMLFLYIFGLIVEGKVGWWRFLLIYNACGIICNAMVNVGLMFSYEPGALGASAPIFGLIAIALVWAPENEVHFKFIFALFLIPYVYSFSASVMLTCFCYLGLNFVIAAFTGFRMSSELIHLLGALPGAAIAFGMLYARRVNCDGYDLLSMWQGKRGQKQLTVEEEADQLQRRKELAREKHEALTQGLEMVALYVERGHFDVGFKRFQSLARSRPELVLTEKLLVRIINGLEPQSAHSNLYRKSLKYYLNHYERLKPTVTFKLAKLLLKQDEQPRQALRLLNDLDQSQLKPAEIQVLGKLAAFAKKQIASGAIEVQSDDES